MTDELFLVDYDIPVEVRGKFYYALRVALASYLRRQKVFRSLEEAWEYATAGGAYVRSTLSVIVTDDEGIARIVYEVANEYGEANLYRAEKLAGPGFTPEKLRELKREAREAEEQEARELVKTILAARGETQ